MFNQDILIKVIRRASKMKTFMDNDFMLKNEAGKRLYSAVKGPPDN